MRWHYGFSGFNVSPAAASRERCRSATRAKSSVEAMMITLDHVGVPVRNTAAAASFLAEILGLAPATPEGPEGEMARLAIGESAVLFFCPAESVAGQHIAGNRIAGLFPRPQERQVVGRGHRQGTGHPQGGYFPYPLRCIQPGWQDRGVGERRR